MAQTVKCLPATWETRVQSLGRKDPLEEEMATHSSTLAWKIPWTEEPCGLQSMGVARIRHDLATKPTIDHGPRVCLFIACPSTHSHLDLTFTEAEVSPVLFTLAA